MRTQYSVATSSVVALTGGTARTALAVLGPSTHGVDLLKFSVGLDGVTTSAVPGLWQICALTAASNSTPGTNNTTETSNILRVGGPTIANSFTAFSASTSEPTVLTVVKSGYLTPVGGLFEYDWPWGDSPDSDVSKGFALRLNYPANVNARAELVFARA